MTAWKDTREIYVRTKTVKAMKAAKAARQQEPTHALGSINFLPLGAVCVLSKANASILTKES